MITAKWSQNAEAVRSRIRRLPKMMIGLMEAGTQNACTAVNMRFQVGIINKRLRLTPLKPETIRRKAAAGGERPDAPLYFLGFTEPNSYANMMEIVKTRPRQWTLRPRDEFHHGKRTPADPPKEQIRLPDLFDVHEYGATITNGFGRGIYIRIPPRPALRYAYHAWLRNQVVQDPTPAVRAAQARYVRVGDKAALDRVKAKL